MSSTNSSFVWLCGVIGFGMMVTSCVTRNWQYLDGFKVNEGLWQHCNLFGCFENGNEKHLIATKALLIVGLALIALGFLMDSSGSCWDRNVVVQMIVMQVIAIACCIGAYAFYAYELKKPLYDWGWSFIVGSAGAGVYALGFLFLASMLCND